MTLNRPQALNAVTLIMVRALRQQLDAWRDDPTVTRVVIIGAGGRAFSAGGDLRQVYELGRSGRQDEALIYWREEYALNSVIKHYPKPYVALLDGIVMGGGVGVSVHGSHRLAGDKFLFAMPEVAIGFFPDVGATWFLPRMPGELGTYCAVTGERLGSADGVTGGIATHWVSSSNFPELLDSLCGPDPVDHVIEAFDQSPGVGPIASRVIDRYLRRRHDRSDPDQSRPRSGNGTARCPMGRRHGCHHSVPITDQCEARARASQVRPVVDFAECMRAEFRIVSRVVYDHDFYEGVRALLIDKDNQPRWQPQTLAEVGDTNVDRYFPPVEHELQLP